jgi:methylisocitrate lyase
MCDRIKAAVDARSDPDFVIMARTDAVDVEGLAAGLERSQAYVRAGADMVFPEALSDLGMYRQFAQAANVPILANMTEFGRTPPFTTDQLRGAGVGLALYPLSAFRAMNKAAMNVYQTIRRDGTPVNALEAMQTRAELYETIRYHEYERKIDELFGESK